ncbi:MAG: murein biosynthesis integral membrane protein MurJ [Alphaproteobacteria bacterium]|nr:murein biosynthesis integral membrane protein MurJ [Alphaproteobacteria bacterium]
MGLFQKFLTVSGLTIASRVFGVVREAVMVHFLGASVEMDAFTTAFKFPSFFRRFFAEGGFQSIFVPYYTDYVLHSKYNGAKYFSSRIFTLIFWVMLVLCVVVFVFAQEFTLLMAPGFINYPEKLSLTSEFTRIIFPSIAFISLSTVYSGILVSRQKFFIFSLAPIFVNIILVGSLFVCQDSISAGRRISYGTLISGIFLLVYMFACVKLLKLPSPRLASVKRSPRIKTFLRKLIPVLAGAGVVQINILVGTVFASFLSTGAITYLYCADRFVQLPLALFGISMGTILLPEIADKIAKQNLDEIQDIQNKSFLFILQMTIPAVVLLIVLAEWMVSLLYGHGKFDYESVISTASVVKISALGLPAFVFSKVLSSILFAQKDTTTTVLATTVSIISNIIFSIMLIKPLGVLGIAISSSLSGYVALLVLYKKSHICFLNNKRLLSISFKILLASGCAFVACSVLKNIIGDPHTKIQELFCIIIIFISGIFVHLASLFVMKDKATIAVVKKILRL